MDNEYHAETAEEEVYRTEYLQKKLLRDQGYHTYANLLDDFRVNFVDDPYITAAIDTTRGIIYLNNAVAYDNQNLVSALIRHELLHKILKHTEREIMHLASLKGWDYKKLTKLEFEELYDIMSRPDFTLRSYNSQRLGNKAADLDLSRYYLDLDKKLLRETGGLMLDDYEGWEKKTFEEIMHECYLANQALRKRAMRKIVGKFSDIDGKRTFTKTGEIESEFKGYVINEDDFIEFTLPTIDEGKLIYNNLGYSYFWLLEADKDDPDLHKVQIGTDIASIDGAKRGMYIYPVAKIKNADLYTDIFTNKFTPCRFSNDSQKWYSIPDTNKVILSGSIADSYFNDYGDGGEFKGSIVEEKLNEFKKSFFSKRN